MTTEQPAEIHEHLDHLRTGHFRYPVCADCNVAQWPPRPVCPECSSDSRTWRDFPPTARLFTWTVVHRTPLAELADQTPFAVGVLSFEELGIRVIGRLAGAPEDLTPDSRYTWSVPAEQDGPVRPVWMRVEEVPA